MGRFQPPPCGNTHDVALHWRRSICKHLLAPKFGHDADIGGEKHDEGAVEMRPADQSDVN